MVWKLRSASRRPCEISGWYGVYAVYQAGFSSRLRWMTGGVMRARVALTDQRDEHLVAVGQVAHVGQHVGFGATDGQVERRAFADRLGDGPVDQLGHRRHVERGEHLLHLDRRRPQVAVGELPAHRGQATGGRTAAS